MIALFRRNIILANLFFASVFLFLVLAQASFLDYLKIFGLKPDLTLVAIVLAGLFLGKSALLFAFFGGFLKDIFVANTFGFNSITFCLWSFLAMLLSKKLTLDSPLTYTVLVLVISVFGNIIRMLTFFFSETLSVPLGIFLKITLLGSLYTALFTPLVWEVLKRPLLEYKTRDYLKTIALIDK